MKKLMLAIAIAAIFAMGSAAYAEEGKLSIRLEPMWMDVQGNDVHVGDVFRYSWTWTRATAVTPTTLLYGITYEPINLNMKDKFTLRPEITYKKNQWGLGLSGWWFNTDASKSGRVTTPPRTATTFYVNGVRMWDHTIMPVRNDLEASRLSPVDYWAENDLKVWTADLFGIRTLAEKKDSHIDMTFGLKLGSLDNDREEGQRQRAFVRNHRFAPGYRPDPDKLIPAPGFHFDNRITLESTSKADYGLMAGPGIGLSGKAKYKGIGLEGLLNQSLLFGKVKQSGTWTDIDDMRTVTEPAFTIVDRFVLDGRFPFSKSETVALPVTEAKLKFLVDVVKNVSVGTGGFTSIWWNAPLAPKWSMPGAWTADGGTGWRLQKETLAFYGGTLALNVRF